VIQIISEKLSNL